MVAAVVSCDSGPAGSTGPAPTFIRPPTPEEAAPAQVVVTPGTDTLRALGETTALGAVVVGADGTVLAGVPVTWTSRAPGVASVGGTSGTVTAQGPGAAEIQAAAGTVSGTARVFVLLATP